MSTMTETKVLKTRNDLRLSLRGMVDHALLNDKILGMIRVNGTRVTVRQLPNWDYML